MSIPELSHTLHSEATQEYQQDHNDYNDFDHHSDDDDDDINSDNSPRRLSVTAHRSVTTTTLGGAPVLPLEEPNHTDTTTSVSFWYRYRVPLIFSSVSLFGKPWTRLVRLVQGVFVNGPLSDTSATSSLLADPTGYPAPPSWMTSKDCSIHEGSWLSGESFSRVLHSFGFPTLRDLEVNRDAKKLRGTTSSPIDPTSSSSPAVSLSVVVWVALFAVTASLVTKFIISRDIQNRRSNRQQQQPEHVTVDIAEDSQIVPEEDDAVEQPMMRRCSSEPTHGRHIADLSHQTPRTTSLRRASDAICEQEATQLTSFAPSSLRHHGDHAVDVLQPIMVPSPSPVKPRHTTTPLPLPTSIVIPQAANSNGSAFSPSVVVEVNEEVDVAMILPKNGRRPIQSPQRNPLRESNSPPLSNKNGAPSNTNVATMQSSPPLTSTFSSYGVVSLAVPSPCSVATIHTLLKHAQKYGLGRVFVPLTSISDLPDETLHRFAPVEYVQVPNVISAIVELQEQQQHRYKNTTPTKSVAVHRYASSNITTAVLIHEFEHPHDAVYVFDPSPSEVGEAANLSWCDLHVVMHATTNHTSLPALINITLYDRAHKTLKERE